MSLCQKPIKSTRLRCTHKHPSQEGCLVGCNFSPVLSGITLGGEADLLGEGAFTAFFTRHTSNKFVVGKDYFLNWTAIEDKE